MQSRVAAFASFTYLPDGNFMAGPPRERIGTPFLSIKPDTVGDFDDGRIQECHALTAP